MSRTRNHSKQLWHGVQEVEYLRNEEQQQGLAEVTKDSYHSKRHARKIAVRVTNKHARGVPAEGGREGGREGEGHNTSLPCFTTY